MEMQRSIAWTTNPPQNARKSLIVTRGNVDGKKAKEQPTHNKHKNVHQVKSKRSDKNIISTDGELKCL